MNFLEQLVAEWFEFKGHFVRRNVLVGPRTKGGYECELDVVAFDPNSGAIIHIEPSMDTHSWAQREERYAKKFKAGLDHIPGLFKGLAVKGKIEQVALLGLASKASRTTLAGGEIWLVSEFLKKIADDMVSRRIESRAVPEQFALLRTVQFVCQHRNAIF